MPTLTSKSSEIAYTATKIPNQSEICKVFTSITLSNIIEKPPEILKEIYNVDHFGHEETFEKLASHMGRTLPKNYLS
jgi:hypothetical protein